MAKNLANFLSNVISKRLTSNLLKVKINNINYRKLTTNSEIDDLSKKVDSLYINFDYNEAKSYKEFLDEKKTNSKKLVVSALMEILNVTKDNASIAVKSYSFNKTTRRILIKNNNLLRSCGVNQSTLKENMYALAESFEELQTKINYLRNLKNDFNHIIPLIKLSIFIYRSYFDDIFEKDKTILKTHENRLEYFCETLQMSMYEISCAISKKPFLLTIDLSKFIEITEYFLKSGVSINDIKNDFIAYRYSMKKIKSRIERASKSQIFPLKLWMIRCPEEILSKIEEQVVERNKIYQSANSTEEFLSNILECDIKDAEALMFRNPHIKTINPKKLSTNINLLKRYGYNIKDIYTGASILSSSTSTIKKRYEEWMGYGLDKPFLSYIASGSKMYNEQLKMAIRNKKY